MSNRIIIKPIDLKKDSNIAIKFHADAFVCGFGNADRFYEADGQGHVRYLEWLLEKQQQDADMAVHIWQGDEVIGQIVLGMFKHVADIGYVNLYYLAPEFRGQGLSSILDEYAVDYFTKLSCKAMRLSVNKQNDRAWHYYLKHGWQEIGPRADQPDVYFMEKVIKG